MLGYRLSAEDTVHTHASPHPKAKRPLCIQQMQVGNSNHKHWDSGICFNFALTKEVDLLAETMLTVSVVKLCHSVSFEVFQWQLRTKALLCNYNVIQYNTSNLY